VTKKIWFSVLMAVVLVALAGPARAEFDMTVYGKFHVSLDYFTSDGVGNGDISDLQISSNNSRIGFKGSELLREGLNAVWQLETRINFNDQQGNTWSTRNSFLGLVGDWGKVIAGKHDTPLKIISRKLDPFGDTIFDTRAIVGSANGEDLFNLRAPNTAMYTSPSWRGVTFMAAYVADVTDNSAAANDNDNQVISVSGTYVDGPLYASLGYETHKDAIGGNDMFRLGASYEFDAMELGAMIEQGSDDGTSVNLIDRLALNVFGVFDFGAHTLKVQVVKASEIDNNDDDSFMWSVGVAHHFTDRTNIYLVAGQLSQGDGGSYFLGGGHNTNTFVQRTPGVDQKAVSVGMVHLF